MDAKESLPVNQHEWFFIAEIGPTNTDQGYAPGSLDLALTKLNQEGRKVMDFWRSGRTWEFKLMAARK